MKSKFLGFGPQILFPSALAQSHSTQCATSTRRAFLHSLAVLPVLSISAAHARGLPPGEAVKNVPETWPEKWPFVDSDFKRFDNADDTIFYKNPRLVHHIDDGAVSALADYCAKRFSASARVLDLCASYESYLSETANVTGLGMNEVEMQYNKALKNFVVHDLNKDPILPFKDRSFDCILCALSIDYLKYPREVLADAARVLKPGGILSIAFSDRLFATKAIAVWTSASDADHIQTVAAFVHFAGGYESLKALDISPRNGRRLRGDPLYVVEAIRKST